MLGGGECANHGSLVLEQLPRHLEGSKIGGKNPRSLFVKMHSKRLVLRPRFFPSPTRAFSAMPKESSILRLGKVENHLVMIAVQKFFPQSGHFYDYIYVT